MSDYTLRVVDGDGHKHNVPCDTMVDLTNWVYKFLFDAEDKESSLITFKVEFNNNKE